MPKQKVILIRKMPLIHNQKWLKNILGLFGSPGDNLFNYLCLKNSVFRSASAAPFSYLDKPGRKKSIDKIYIHVFNELFILLKSLHTKGDILEFGVFQGYSALLLAKKMKQFEMKGSSLHLFDSFAGLPEGKEIDTHSYEQALHFWEKGAMNVSPGMDLYLKRKLGKILSHNRIHVIKGFFEQTLAPYFDSLTKPKAKLVHIDCDLYSATKYVLDFLLKREIIQDGTLLIFDDWMTSLGNPNLGQRKAVEEVMSAYPAWSLEKYLNYGVGSHVFVAHDLRITDARSVIHNGIS